MTEEEFQSQEPAIRKAHRIAVRALTPPKIMGIFESVVMTAVFCYPTRTPSELWKIIEKIYETEIVSGAIYTTLLRLHQKGYVQRAEDHQKHNAYIYWADAKGIDAMMRSYKTMRRIMKLLRTERPRIEKVWSEEKSRHQGG